MHTEYSEVQKEAWRKRLRSALRKDLLADGYAVSYTATGLRVEKDGIAKTFDLRWDSYLQIFQLYHGDRWIGNFESVYVNQIRYTLLERV